MSIIFGILKSGGINKRVLAELGAATDRFACDGTFIHSHGDVGMGFQPYHTHERSGLEAQPAVDRHGNMLVFDGRLDNFDQLRRELGVWAPSPSDSAIVLAAFGQWGESCFSRFIGDWALGLWSPSERSLFLARDHAGTRTLYYKATEGCIRWSTSLETLFYTSPGLELEPQFVADYLGGQTNLEQTPYRGIKAVPPAHYLAFRPKGIVCKPHWQWMSTDKLLYRTDAEYEEHFLGVFRTAVERRIGPGAPILAQLSGGMDSSSIVCMADCIRRDQGAHRSDLIHTISYFDDSEPHWNEKPYFSAVESSRGQRGIHVDNAAYPRTWTPSGSLRAAYLLPGMDQVALQREIEMQNLMGDEGYRVILSGLGGDELLGGVPTPYPELADLLVSGHWNALWQQSVQWCLTDRSPIHFMLLRTLRLTCSCYFGGQQTPSASLPWLRIAPGQEGRAVPVPIGLFDRMSFPPSAICNQEAWWSILRSLPSSLPDYLIRYEYRYPYLDRDLATFLFQVPREQLVRPGQRRSLMRRALRGIVPPEVLQRRRKGYLIRNAALHLDAISHSLSATDLRSLAVVRRGFVDPQSLGEALARIGKGQNPEWVSPLWRTLLFDLWLRSFDAGFARSLPGIPDPQRTPRTLRPCSVEIQQKEVEKCAT
jgi:asparagine synthase (glutamine-hydrolysing)